MVIGFGFWLVEVKVCCGLLCLGIDLYFELLWGWDLVIMVDGLVVFCDICVWVFVDFVVVKL